MYQSMLEEDDRRGGSTNPQFASPGLRAQQRLQPRRPLQISLFEHFDHPRHLQFLFGSCSPHPVAAVVAGLLLVTRENRLLWLTVLFLFLLPLSNALLNRLILVKLPNMRREVQCPICLDPIFSFSPLAIHTRNLLADPCCTLVVQIPGWSSLSNARVTIFGDVYPLPGYQQEWAHKQYIAKHQQGPSQQWGNFYYFRMQNIRDIYFIRGFGTFAWVDVKEYEDLKPDKIAAEGGEQYLKELNAIFSKPLKELLSAEAEVDDAALISLNSKGTDIRVRQGAQFNVQRISFDEAQAIETLEQAKAALRMLICSGVGKFILGCIQCVVLRCQMFLSQLATCH